MPVDKHLWDEHEARLVNFLLGRLPAAEQEEIENRTLTEDGFLNEVLATGDELIHAYLDGSLSGEDKTRFEMYFLASPLRRQRFELVRDIGTAVRDHAPARPRALPPWVLAVAASLLLAAGLLALRFAVSPPPDDRIAQETPTPATPPPTAGETTPVVRLPATTSQTVAILVSATTRTVRIEVPIEDDRHPTFDASVRTPEGTTVWQTAGLVPPGPGLALVVMVPAEVLVADAYSLVVEGEKLRDAPRQKRLSLTYALRVARPR